MKMTTIFLVLVLFHFMISSSWLMTEGSLAQLDDDVSGSSALTSLISRRVFDEVLFPYRKNCHTMDFYTYNAFIEAAKSFPRFAATGNTETRKKEIAAFLAQTSQQTSGVPAQTSQQTSGRQDSWGYCYVNSNDPRNVFCDYFATGKWPCVTGKSYHGRGPMQITGNSNYGAAGRYLKLDLLGNPDVVAQDPIISFKTALWFWMTPHAPNAPSCHAIITGKWQPTSADKDAGRLPGYGACTNIITGGEECTREWSTEEYRIEYYLRYCAVMGVRPGENLSCRNNQKPWPPAVEVDNGLLHIDGITSASYSMD